MKPSKKILVIDDEAAIRKFLRVALESEGYAVAEADRVQAGLRLLVEVRPDLVILDLGLPDADGQTLIERMREWSQIPILVLTVKEDEESKVRALDAGADDYLIKPFSVPELLARLRVAERHGNGMVPAAVFRSGALEVDLAAHVVRLGEQEIHLTATEYDILALLIRHAGKVLTQRQILREVWGPNSVEHTQYLRVYMGQLRKKIEPGDLAKKLIVTEPGVGYRLLIL